MASRSGSVSLLVDVPDSRRAARRIAVLIVWAWLAAACGLGICTVILLSLSAPWFGAIALFLGVGALIRALSLRRTISAARLRSIRLMPSPPSGPTGPSTHIGPRPALADVMSGPPPLDLAGASSAAMADSPHTTSLRVGPDAGKQVDLDGFTGRIPAGARFTEHELQDLGLDRWESDAYRSSDDAGGHGIGLWIGVGIILLIGVVVIRGRSAKAKRAEVGRDAATDAVPAPASARNVSKILQSSLVEGTTSAPGGAPENASAGTTTAQPDPDPPSSVGDAPRPPRRFGRFTPSPKLARFAVIPLLTSFVLAYLAIRAAGDNSISASILLACVSFVALGLAFSLAPAS